MSLLVYPSRTLCALDCLDIRAVGLLATFVPSLANGTVRNRCCYVRLRRPSIRCGRPRGAQVKLHKGPAGLLHVVSRGDAVFNNDGMRAVSLSLLLGRFYRIPPHLASKAARLC